MPCQGFLLLRRQLRISKHQSSVLDLNIFHVALIKSLDVLDLFIYHNDIDELEIDLVYAYQDTLIFMSSKFKQKLINKYIKKSS